MKGKIIVWLIGVFVFGGASVVYAQAPFITTWQTDNSGTSCSSCITIPTTGGGYNYEVDWDNDGVYDQSGITGDVTHDFLTPGNYTIRLRGDFPRIYFAQQGIDSEKLIDIVQWGDINWSSMESAFGGCRSLNISATDAPNLSNVMSLAGMFSLCTSFNSNINHWNITTITDLSGMFSGFLINVPFNQPLDQWDVSNVSDMSFMFNTSSFNQDISMWNTSNVVFTNSMFQLATNFAQDISMWNMANVIDMSAMFNGASSFNADISNWDVTNVQDFEFTFQGASSFNQNLNSWDINMAITLNEMFKNAILFDFSLDSWDLGSNSSLIGVFENSGLSCENYSNTLIGWANNPNTPNNKDLGPLAGMEYAAGLATTARQDLINMGWTFSGDVQGSCTILCSLPAGQQQDYDALIALYNSTNGDNWTNNGTNADPQSTTAGWNKDCDVCEWYGIQCDGNDRVTCIDLDGTFNCSSSVPLGNNLIGVLPPELGDLSMLENLHLHENNISGNIPLEIGSLLNLETLSLHRNSLTGSIPSSLGNLVNLFELSLSFNNLDGSIPSSLGNMVALESMALGDNMLSGNIPPELGNLTSLRGLVLIKNQLIGNIPIQLGNLINIEQLSLGDNLLIGSIPPALGNLSNLNWLVLADNDLSGIIPASLGNLTNLTNFFLNDNQLSGCIPNELQNLCVSGATVDISNNPLLDNDDWSSFCSFGVGICSSCPTEYTITYPDNTCEGEPFDFVVDVIGGSGPFDINIVDALGTSYGQVFGVNGPSITIPANFVPKGTYTFSAEITDNGNLCTSVIRSGISSAEMTIFTGGYGASLLGNPNNVCFDGSIVVEMNVTPEPMDNPPYQYSFNYEVNGNQTMISETSSSNPFTYTISPLESGFYDFNGFGVTDNSGCSYIGSSPVLSTEVQEEGRALIFPSMPTQCAGYNYTIIVEVIGGLAPYNIELLEDGIFVDSKTLNSSGGFVTFLVGANPSGSYNYSAIISDQLNCSFDVTNASIDVLAAPTPTIISDPHLASSIICFNETVSFEPQDPNAYQSYFWEPSGISDQPLLITGSGNGQDATIELWVTDNNGCTGSSSLTYEELNSVYISGDIMTTNTLSGNSTGTATIINLDGQRPIIFEWDGTSSGSSESSLEEFTITDLARGNYSVTLTDQDGCFVIESFSIDASDCTHPDLNNLRSFFTSTNGPTSWTNITITGWDDPAACDPCNYNGSPWSGIVCDNANERVTGIYLANNGLSGEMILLSDLDSLEEVVLEGNDLNGGNWNFTNPNLRVINISNNQKLGTPIPDFNLPNLKELYCSGDSLFGGLPTFENCPSLEELFVYNNPLGGTVQLADLDSLRQMSLFNCQLSGVLPILESSSRLISFYGNSNTFTGDLLDYSYLTELDTLVLDDNDLSGCLPVNIYCDFGWFDVLNNLQLPYNGDYTQICPSGIQDNVICQSPEGDASGSFDEATCTCQCDLPYSLTITQIDISNSPLLANSITPANAICSLYFNEEATDTTFEIECSMVGMTQEIIVYVESGEFLCWDLTVTDSTGICDSDTCLLQSDYTYPSTICMSDSIWNLEVTLSGGSGNYDISILRNNTSIAVLSGAGNLSSFDIPDSIRAGDLVIAIDDGENCSMFRDTLLIDIEEISMNLTVEIVGGNTQCETDEVSLNIQGEGVGPWMINLFSLGTFQVNNLPTTINLGTFDPGSYEIDSEATDGDGCFGQADIVFLDIEAEADCTSKPIILGMPNVVSAVTVDVEIPITVENFDALTNLDFTIEWDNSFFQFSDMQNINSNLNPDFSFTPITAGLQVEWSNASSLSLPQNTKLFDLQLSLTGVNCTGLLVEINEVLSSATNLNNEALSITGASTTVTLPLDGVEINQLTVFYETLGGNEWFNSDGWSDPSNNCNPCQWYGVTCFPDLDSIYIDLSDNGLSGCDPILFTAFCADLDLMGIKVGIDLGENEGLPFSGDLVQICDYLDVNGNLIGAACDDGEDSNGTNDVMDEACNCGPSVCRGISCTTDTLVRSIGINPILEIEDVLEQADGNCTYSFDSVQEISSIMFDCNDACQINRISVYNLNDATSCMIFVYVRAIVGACSSEVNSDQVDLSLTDIQNPQIGQEVEVDLVANGFDGVTAFSMDLTYENNVLEWIGFSNEIPFVNPISDFTNNPIRLRSGSPLIYSAPDGTILAKMRFRVIDDALCDQTLISVDANGVNGMTACDGQLRPFLISNSIANFEITPPQITNQTFCSGALFDVEITNASSYTFIDYPYQGDTSLDVSGQLLFSFMDINGCSLDTLIDIEISSPSDIQLPVETICPDSLATYTIADWQGNYPLVAGENTVELIDNDGCIYDQSVIVVLDENLCTPCMLVIDEPDITGILPCGNLSPFEFSIAFNYEPMGCDQGGEVLPIVEWVIDQCDSSAVLTWLLPDGRQVVQTLSHPSTFYDFAWSDALEDINIPCNEINDYTAPDLTLSNGMEGACFRGKTISPTYEYSFGDCGDTILIRWVAEDLICDLTVARVQTVTADCSTLEVEDVYQSVETQVDLTLDIPDYRTGYSFDILSINSEIFTNEGFNEGVLSFRLEQSFFDTIKVEYELCEANCAACDQATLFIVDKILEDVIITTVISPNGDGKNDRLQFTAEPEIEDSQLWIYNRWGDEIYEASPYRNDWEAEGKPSGVYFYVLRIGGAEAKRTLTILK